MRPYTEGFTYHVYRADSEDGTYEQIGISTTSVFRDEAVAYTAEYCYKVQAVMVDEKLGVVSQPMK